MPSKPTILPPDFGHVGLYLESLTPLVMHKFSSKARAKMREDAEKAAGARGRKKVPKDFGDELTQALHRSEEGWPGFPASGFRNAAISACGIIGYKMTLAKKGIFVEAEGIDDDENVPLIRIYGDYTELESVVRSQNSGGSSYVVRPVFKVWSAKLIVNFDQGLFTGDDIVNLYMRAGIQVGIGEGRPDSKNSNGMGWGTFKTRSMTPEEYEEHVNLLTRNEQVRMARTQPVQS